jgi:hypothetical protein
MESVEKEYIRFKNKIDDSQRLNLLFILCFVSNVCCRFFFNIK